MSNLLSSHCLTCILIHNWEILGVSKKQNVAWIILNCSSGSSRFKSKILNILDTSHGQSYAARDCLSCARSSVSSAGRVVTGLGWFIIIHGTWGCHDYNGDLVVQQLRMMINKSWVDGDLDGDLAIFWRDFLRGNETWIMGYAMSRLPFGVMHFTWRAAGKPARTRSMVSVSELAGEF